MAETSTIWIDVDDLFHYVRHNARLSGIQRLTYELYTAIEQRAALFGRRTGYLRIDPATDDFVPVRWEQVRALCHGLTTAHEGVEGAKPSPAAPPRTAASQTAASHTAASQTALPRAGRAARLRASGRRGALWVNHRLPVAARPRFQRFCTLQVEALRALGGIVAPDAMRDVASGGAAGGAPAEPAARGPFGRGGRRETLSGLGRPGDWLLSLGASWHRTDYGALLERARRRGLRTALLVYDLIPLRRPEWCHHTLVRDFGAWLDGVLPATDALFAISDATARDLRALLAERRAAPRGAIATMPVGTGFPASEAGALRAAEPVPDWSVPAPGTYVLFVSTIEARKNHALMFQAWRRLAETLPPERLPTLVFAGRIGWLVSDLLRQIANTNYCDGKLLIIEDPSDAVLMRLYQGCLFTVLPSLFEGWGLPVTESLAAGKPCVTSDNTSLPEAGAGLTRMLDACDLNGATRLLHDTLSDRAGLAEWEARVRREFRPVPWTDSADAILSGLAAHEAA